MLMNRTDTVKETLPKIISCMIINDNDAPQWELNCGRGRGGSCQTESPLKSKRSNLSRSFRDAALLAYAR